MDLWRGCPHGEDGPHYINGSITRCTGYNVGVPRRSMRDPDWVEHEGYPRDFTELELMNRGLSGWEANMASTSIDIPARGHGVLRVAQERAGALNVGDVAAVDPDSGKVVNALGSNGARAIGVVMSVDHQRQMIEVRMS